MQKTIIILVSFIFLGCTSENKPTDNYKLKGNLNELSSPIFLGLSPKMEPSVYSFVYDSLNKNHHLENGRFILPINGKNYPFIVINKSDYILLSFSDTISFFYDRYYSGHSQKNNENKHVADLRKWIDKCQKQINNYDLLFKEIKLMYKNKYPQRIKQHFTLDIQGSKDFFSYFNQEKLPKYILKDSVKTILLYYDVEGTSERILKEVDSNNEIMKL